MKKNIKLEKLTVSELSKITGGVNQFTDTNKVNGGDDWSYNSPGSQNNDCCLTTTASGDTKSGYTKKAVWI